jgi:capsular exopolysaccharide synthesis family protein
MKVFAVAGLDGGADATKTTAELAIALAQGGRTVAAVSANLRKPALNRLLGVGSSIGLASVLTGEADLDEALIQTSTPGLSVIASGLTSDLPPELLDTDQMRAVVKELRSSFDFLLLDTAPQPWAADTLSLVPLTDGVIVTAVSGRTLRDDVARLRALVEGVGGQIAGGILKERPSRWHRGGAARAPARANAARTRDTGVLRPADESYEDGDGMADAAAG